MPGEQVVAAELVKFFTDELLLDLDGVELRYQSMQIMSDDDNDGANKNNSNGNSGNSGGAAVRLRLNLRVRQFPPLDIKF